MKGLALEPGLDSSPRARRGLGVLRGPPARHPSSSHIPSPARRPPGSSVGHDGAGSSHPTAPDGLLQRRHVPPERPGTLPSPAAPPAPLCRRQKRCPKRRGGTLERDGWSLFAVIVSGLPLPSQSLPGKWGLSTPGAATPGFVPRLGATSAPAAPPKGLTGAGKPASPPGDGRVALAWGSRGLWLPHTPSPGVAAPPPRRDGLPQRGR